LVEGRHAVAEALDSQVAVRELFVVADAPGAAGLCSAARAARVPVTSVSPRVMQALAGTTTPQGVVAVVEAPAARLQELVAGASLVVVLADVRDPGNAGTLVRSAAAAGADAIVFCSGAVDALHPKTVRSAAGSLWRLPVVRDVSLPDCAAELRAAGLVVVGADASAPRQLYEADLTRRLGLVLGNESWGISGEAGALLDEAVSVPVQPGVDSLNVAVAGSVILFEAARQRRAGGGPPRVVYPRRHE
jgi:TrmH family RNA methyltransferase